VIPLLPELTDYYTLYDPSFIYRWTNML